MEIKVKQNNKTEKVKVKKPAEPVITEYVCQMCGKKFTAEGKYRRKFCSEECKKAHLAKYNYEYITKRRKTDSEFADKSRMWANKVGAKCFAKKKWQSNLDSAEAILKLAGMKDAKILIAKYLDLNFVVRGAGFKERSYKTEEEIKAAEVLESLGDEFLTSM